MSFLMNSRSLFYGDLEKNHLNHLVGPDDVLSLLSFFLFFWKSLLHRASFLRFQLIVRFVDDFLFITPDQKKFTTFIARMHQGNCLLASFPCQKKEDPPPLAGFPDYGCTVNASKTQVNCGVKLNGVVLERVLRSQTGDCEFPFCGHLINDRTLEVRADQRQAKASGMFLPSTQFQNEEKNTFFDRLQRPADSWPHKEHRSILSDQSCAVSPSQVPRLVPGL